AAVRATFGTVADARSRFALLNGAPDERVEIAHHDLLSGDGARCAGLLVPIEVWAYDRNARVHEPLRVVLFRPGSIGSWRRWEAADGLDGFVVRGNAMTSSSDPAEALGVARGMCPQAMEAFDAARSFIVSQEPFHYPLLMLRAEAPMEKPSREWLSTFAAYS